MIKKILIFIFALVIIQGGTRLSFAGDREIVDKIVAIVGSKIILLSEVQKEAEDALVEIERTAATQGGGTSMMLNKQKKQVVRKTLDAMIDDILVKLQAEEMKISVTSQEVDSEKFEQRLLAMGKDPLDFKAKLRKDVLKYKVLNLRVRGRVNVTEQRAREYYNEQVRDVRATGSFEGAHILVRVPKSATALMVKKLRDEAVKIYKKIASGDNFLAVAKKISDDDATAPYGGRLGVRNPGEIPEVLDRVFLDMEPGEMMGPIRTPAGFHIIKLLSRESLGIQPFANVKHRIVNQLMQEEMVRQQEIWLKDLRLRTFIDIRM